MLGEDKESAHDVVVLHLRQQGGGGHREVYTFPWNALDLRLI